MKEYMFSDLSLLAEPADNIAAKWENGSWKAVEYTTGKCSGCMLVAPEGTSPGAVELKIGLSGRYRIYVCIPRFRQDNYIYLKLSGDRTKSGIKAMDKNRPNHWLWADEEYLEEIYWKTADLTGQSIIIEKPDTIINTVSGIAWIRCVPEMTTEKSVENKFVQYHMDEDCFAEDSFGCDDDYLIRLAMMKNTNADFVSYEVSFDYDMIKNPNSGHLWKMDERWDKGQYEAKEKLDMIYKRAVGFAHENGIKLYAANRMQQSGFYMPYTRYSWNKGFSCENSGYYLKTRNGTTVNILSYAFDEVQEYMIKNLTDVLKYGFDGLTLCYNRGVTIGFEQPVIDRFKTLYPDVDPFVLPMTDERLNGVMCGFMNDFMEKLRKAVDETTGRHIKINVVTDYSPKSSKHYGLDVEYWAKNGLVDSISQADIETFEVLDGCMDDNNPDIIDLEKYTKMLEERPVIRRVYGFDSEKILRCIPDYLRLGERYGVEIYNTMPNIRNCSSTEEFYSMIETMKAHGVKKFLSWNASHLSFLLPEWYITSRSGNEIEEYMCERKYHRVLSLDGIDIGQFNPNWRG